MEFVDRISTYPGRVKLNPVAGQTNVYDMVRADEPTEPGTPINRALFQSIIGQVNAIGQQIDERLFELSQRTRVGDLVDGTVFGLYENGVLVPFIKLSHSTYGTARVVALRQSCVTADVLANVGDTYYENCRTDLWLNNEYLPTLDSVVKAVISSVNVKVRYASGTTTISRKAFLLSYDEYNFGSAGFSYFNSAARRIATLNGKPTNHWTRDYQNAGYVTTDGTILYATASTFVAGIRPAFTLPIDFEVTVGVPSTANTMATAEVI